MRNFYTSRPKLPAFDEQKDDLDVYLERYERFTTSQEWDEGDDWAVSLNPLLTGKGLQVYSSMPPGDANNYDKLQTALLQRYELTVKMYFVGNSGKTNQKLAKQCFSL